MRLQFLFRREDSPRLLNWQPLHAVGKIISVSVRSIQNTQADGVDKVFLCAVHRINKQTVWTKYFCAHYAEHTSRLFGQSVSVRSIQNTEADCVDKVFLCAVYRINKQTSWTKCFCAQYTEHTSRLDCMDKVFLRAVYRTHKQTRLCGQSTEMLYGTCF